MGVAAFTAGLGSALGDLDTRLEIERTIAALLSNPSRVDDGMPYELFIAELAVTHTPDRIANQILEAGKLAAAWDAALRGTGADQANLACWFRRRSGQLTALQENLEKVLGAGLDAIASFLDQLVRDNMVVIREVANVGGFTKCVCRGMNFGTLGNN
jgi:hypothetical protein